MSAKVSMTRRQMLKLMGATGATAALVACGGATATPAPTTAPTTAPAATDAPTGVAATEAVTNYCRYN